MIKTVRNWTVGILFIGTCLIGFAGPLLWPHLYEPMVNTGIYGIPLVQHHVEFCVPEAFNPQTFCEPLDPLKLA